MSSSEAPALTGTEIAIVGMAGRFPGARTVDEFWRNLHAGVESLTVFDDETLRAAGVDDATLGDPSYVKVGAVMPDMEEFDAGFFGFSPRDAAILDPQHRHFLECAWEALEHAGHVPEHFAGPIGVFAGSGYNAYMPLNLLPNQALMRSVGFFLVRHTGNDKDFLTTRASYLLNLRGPSVNVQTACSTSLVAIHQAAQSLLAGECDMALAGAVTIEMPHRRGYHYQEGEILSPDGHCRPFDAAAQGTVFGSGVGIVVLRRLADALADGDTVYAVVRGTAVNNDGARKVGYLAPSVDGQVDAISEALAVAGVEAETVTLVEAHGTGTAIGDPIEVAALTQAFRRETDARGYCALGSVKSNIGHLDTAAGVAGVIKVVQAMRHGEIPPTLHWTAPNAAIDLASSPFYVNADRRPWTSPAGVPRRAGVSSLGVGGTNAHVILEEAPAATGTPPARAWQVLPMSARTAAALDEGARRLADHLGSEHAPPLADAAWTLQGGRRAFAQRRIVVARDAAEASALLAGADPRRVFQGSAPDTAPEVVFLFAGGGAQYAGMGRDLYAGEAGYRAAVDEALAMLEPALAAEVRALMLAAAPDAATSARLERATLALPALFITQYAVARQLMAWGVKPAAMAGHSLGEYTAACLAGVLTLREALALVTLRARLFDTLPAGAMLSVPMSEAALLPHLGDALSIAAVNAPELCVASGPVAAIDALERTLTAQGVDVSRLHIAVAAHSAMLEPILEEFGALARTLRPRAPGLPVVSNVSGTWMTSEEATDPTYWVRHLRRTVRFADGARTLLEGADRVLVEVGPGQTLVSLARLHPARRPGTALVTSMRHARETADDVATLLTTIGRVWTAGVDVRWEALHEGERRVRVALPTYAWDHQRYWVEPVRREAAAEPATAAARRDDVGEWISVPRWHEAASPAAAATPPAHWLVFEDATGLGAALASEVVAAGARVTRVRAGDAFARDGDDAFTVRPASAEDHDALVAALASAGALPAVVAHLWAVTGEARLDVDAAEARCFDSPMLLLQALGRIDGATPPAVLVVSDGMQQVAGEPVTAPEKAVLLGPVTVAPSELPGLRARSVDVVASGVASGGAGRRALVRQLVAEATATDEPVVALRGHRRFVLRHEQGAAPVVAATDTRLRRGGVYLVTGGLGGVALTVADVLAEAGEATIVLAGRTALPPRAGWDAMLAGAGAADATVERIRRVRALEARGARVEPWTADVADEAQARALVDGVRARFGALHGVVHAAGVLDDGLLALKTTEAAHRVLRPKVLGALALDAAIGDAPLDFMVLFSSVSAFSGLPGQVDYAAANAFLDAFAHARLQRREGLTVSIAWGAWQEVGMAAALADRLRLAVAAPVGAPRAAHPLLGEVARDDAEGRDYVATLRVRDAWLLDEHRLATGEALMPGTGYLELARAAFAERHAGPVEMSDVAFLAPFVVPDEGSRGMHVSLRRDGADWEWAVRTNASADRAEHAHGRVRALAGATPAALDVTALRARCTDRVVERRGDEPEAHLRFGPRWHNLRRVALGRGEAVLDLALRPDLAGDLTRYALHPALLDLTTAGAQALVPGYDAATHFYVPLSYGRLRMHAPLAATLVSHVRLRAGGEETATYDVTVADASGRVLVEVEAFTMRRVRELAQMAGTGAAVTHTVPAVANHVLDGLREAIRPREGAEAFRRVLGGAERPHVVVTPQPLSALLATLRAANTAPAADPGEVAPAHARPALATPYAAPRNELELTVAEVWRTMLGLDDVGVFDNFFELGGHSLLLTQTASRVRKATGVDVALRVLFEQPTIADLAAEIERRRDRQADAAPAIPTLRAVSRDAYRTNRGALTGTSAS